jgi:hypothetical protein
MMDSIRKHPLFSSQCFWDMDYTKLDLEADKNFIIARVVSMGGSRDELELFKFYGWDIIKQEVVKIRYLNDKILNYLSYLFEIPKESFRCFTNRGIF